ncbi:hypothetical protein [Nocardioides insulae]|uniref:hypothetical protein n=1 Tax=Nocardioides insulae TaxID=394734 RepID=UPI0003F58172|nr:hypothetical protein [Nocardioides insulae]
MKRLIALVASVFMAASLTLLVSPSSAHASSTTNASEGRSLITVDGVSARRKCLTRVNQPGTRQVNLCANVRRGKLVLTGKVFPKYAKAPVQLQYKKRVNGKWKTVQRHRTNKFGKYNFTAKKTGYYRTQARAGKGFRASFSDGYFSFYRY